MDSYEHETDVDAAVRPATRAPSVAGDLGRAPRPAPRGGSRSRSPAWLSAGAGVVVLAGAVFAVHGGATSSGSSTAVLSRPHWSGGGSSPTRRG